MCEKSIYSILFEEKPYQELSLTINFPLFMNLPKVKSRFYLSESLNPNSIHSNLSDKIEKRTNHFYLPLQYFLIQPIVFAIFYTSYKFLSHYVLNNQSLYFTFLMCCEKIVSGLISNLCTTDSPHLVFYRNTDPTRINLVFLLQRVLTLICRDNPIGFL